ncbi:MAG: NUMOD3 domain-containing DNA-binding protein, partial [Candidatus Paceibacterota bacterium]
KNQIPWNKGLTKETNIIMLKISIANTGKHLSKETKQKLREARAKQTIILTEETKKKISIANTGKHHSKETRKRISEGHKGQIAWNKGLTKNNDIRIANYSIKLLGNLSWNKGKRLSDEHRKN